MISYPNCKVNIGLRVVGEREDGYHNLETIFYPIYGLHDTLEVTLMNEEEAKSCQKDIVFSQTGIAIDCPEEKNLIVRCYRKMKAAHPEIGAVKVRLNKVIPFGAGLGGGSSDAAHLAIMLNEMFQVGLSKEELAETVRELGADCPFFIYNIPCFATGVGEKLTPIALRLKGIKIVMVKPDVAVSTREAYAHVKNKGAFPHWQQAIEEGPLSQSPIAHQAFHNDFEDSVFVAHPEMAAIKRRLTDAGAKYVAMSGSGSTIFGLFQDNTEDRSLAQLGLLDKDFASMIIFHDTLG